MYTQCTIIYYYPRKVTSTRIYVNISSYRTTLGLKLTHKERLRYDSYMTEKLERLKYLDTHIIFFFYDTKLGRGLISRDEAVAHLFSVRAVGDALKIALY
jgi:hypothetical protein